MIATQNQDAATEFPRNAREETVVGAECLLRRIDTVKYIAGNEYQVWFQLSERSQQPIEKVLLFGEPFAVDESGAKMPIRGMKDSRHVPETVLIRTPAGPVLIKSFRVTEIPARMHFRLMNSASSIS